jgi:glycosyltransferase involved in cell wall biosynthesis
MQVRHAANGGAAPLISLVFPAYNPGTLVDSTWQQVQAFRQWAPGEGDWEFLFVCDGCTDGTPERLRTLTQGQGERVRVLSYRKNRGKGYAVRLGLQAARGQWRLFTDIDLAYSFGDIARLADILQNGAEVAIASRVHPESRVLLPPQLLGYLYRRRLQSLIFGTVVRCLLPIKAGDTQAGLKGLSAEAAATILPRLRCCGFEFDCELLMACARLGFDVTEVPVTVRHDDSASTTAMGDMTKMLRKLWHIRRTWRRVPRAAPLLLPEPTQGEAA